MTLRNYIVRQRTQSPARSASNRLYCVRNEPIPNLCSSGDDDRKSQRKFRRQKIHQSPLFYLSCHIAASTLPHHDDSSCCCPSGGPGDCRFNIRSIALNNTTDCSGVLFRAHHIGSSPSDNNDITEKQNRPSTI